MENRNKLNQFECPMKLEESSFFLLTDFAEGIDSEKASIYDAYYEKHDPHIFITSSIFTKAQAEKVFLLTMDFSPCPFSAEQKGYLKLFLYPDRKVLGNAYYDPGSPIKKDYLSGNYFLDNEYIYLELAWESQAHNRTLLTWGWTDLGAGMDPVIFNLT